MNLLTSWLYFRLSETILSSFDLIFRKKKGLLYITQWRNFSAEQANFGARFDNPRHSWLKSI